MKNYNGIGGIMKDYVFIDIHPNQKKVVEGGLARTFAIRNWIFKNIKDIKVVELHKSKKRVFKMMWFLLIAKDKSIIYIYPQLGFSAFKNTFNGKLLFIIFYSLLKRAGKRNELIFDIPDLKYEQAIDLQLNRYDLNRTKYVEKKIFSLPAKFIFASNEMQKYALKKYQLNVEKTDVCINGGDKVRQCDDKYVKKLNKKIMNYVYAGTLNKGRSIKQMIDSFPNSNKFQLYLLGPQGEWINEFSRDNIHYLGELLEDDAHYFVSHCDVGLIPYDDSLLYYNIAYPTKLSFYITAGIPYLSTPVREVLHLNQEMGWTEKLTAWSSKITKISRDKIIDKKKIIQQEMPNYLWDEIYSKNKFIQM